MESESIIRLTVYSLCLAPFLLCSAFFSGTETAFFSLNSLERESLRLKAGSSWKRFVRRILAQPDRLLVTILTGNMLVNVFATDFFASTIMEEISILLRIPEEKFFSIISLPELFSITAMTLLILIFGEMTPKNLAVRHPVAFARVSILPLFLAGKVLKPFTFMLGWVQTRIMHRIDHRRAENEEFKSELLSLTVQVGYREKMLNKFEYDLFESYIEFRNKTASDVMIPRTELKGVDISTAVDDVLAGIQGDCRYYLSPYIYVFQDDLDHICGYLDLRDLLPYKFGLKHGEGLAALLKPFYSIPETKPLTVLISELRQKNIKLAHVVDEYGGTAGILSFQHLIEDVFDYFYKSQDEIVELGNNWYKVAGSVELERIEELLEVSFPSEARTISGLLMEYLGEIPESGRHIVFQGIDFIISKATKNKIIALELRKQ